MGVNYANLSNGENIFDIRYDTVIPESLLKGFTAHDKAGNPIIGTKEFKTQVKSATPTKSSQKITPDNGYDGLSQVTVNGIPDDFIDIADLINHCTKSASGTFAGAGQTFDKLSIGLNFRAKILIVAATSVLATSNNSSPYDTAMSLRVYDNNFDAIRDLTLLVHLQSSKARTNSNGSNGLRSNADNTITGWGTSMKFTSGITYSWYAWG